MLILKRRGMLGALMHEYERSTVDLINILSKLNLEDFTKIRDRETKDHDCKSIQSVINHIVQSGYTYANYINSVFDDSWIEYHIKIATPQQGIEEIKKVLNYTENQLKDKYDLPKEQIESWSFNTRWGTTYDIEQLLEHAIVHILRHRFQIEKFLVNKLQEMN